MMWPLLLCAIISVAVMIERTMALRAMTKGGSGLAERAIALLKQGKNEEASRLIEGTQDPAGKLLATAMLNRHLEPKELEGMLELQALEDIPKLSHRLNFLDTIITIAPLLGLLGTVTGMIGAFHVVGDPNNLNSPAAITGGVAEALIATATGLVIAIVTLVGYNSLVERVKQIVSSMEIAGTQAVLFFQPSEQAKETESYEARTTRV